VGGAPETGRRRDRGPQPGRRAESPFDSRFSSYEDRRVDHVTLEPTIDSTVPSIPLIAALTGRR
jgi:hypothetical protein